MQQTYAHIFRFATAFILLVFIGWQSLPASFAGNQVFAIDWSVLSDVAENNEPTGSHTDIYEYLHKRKLKIKSSGPLPETAEIFPDTLYNKSINLDVITPPPEKLDESLYPFS